MKKQLPNSSVRHCDVTSVSQASFVSADLTDLKAPITADGKQGCLTFYGHQGSALGCVRLPFNVLYASCSTQKGQSQTA